MANSTDTPQDRACSMLAQQIEQWGLCQAIGNLSADEERQWAKFFLSSLSEKKPMTNYRKCFTALVTLLPMAKAAIPHPSCTVAYASSIAQADQAIHEALHPDTRADRAMSQALNEGDGSYKP